MEGSGFRSVRRKDPNSPNAKLGLFFVFFHQSKSHLSALALSLSVRLVPRHMEVEPRKRKYQVVPSPWYVHPFEVNDRGVPKLLPYYDRNAPEANRAEFFSDVLFALYGDYFRHTPRCSGAKLVWYCPAADQKDNVIVGELDAKNAVEWVQVPDAVDTMSDYLSSGDFYRVCNDTARDLEMNTVAMTTDQSNVELRRVGNVLTSFSDLSMDDSLYAALKRHLRENDSRWVRSAPPSPGTPPATRASPFAGDGCASARTPDSAVAEKENSRAQTDVCKSFKRSLFLTEGTKAEENESTRKALGLRRTNSTHL